MERVELSSFHTKEQDEPAVTGWWAHRLTILFAGLLSVAPFIYHYVYN